MSRYTTDSTKVGSIYFCRVSIDGHPVVQTRVKQRSEIGPAFRDLLRTLDTLGGDKFTNAARYRQWKEGNTSVQVRHEWLR
jgi:hypothetical protein